MLISLKSPSITSATSSTDMFTPHNDISALLMYSYKIKSLKSANVCRSVITIDFAGDLLYNGAIYMVNIRRCMHAEP